MSRPEWKGASGMAVEGLMCIMGLLVLLGVGVVALVFFVVLVRLAMGGREAQGIRAPAGVDHAQREEMIHALPASVRQRYFRLATACRKVLKVHEQLQREDFALGPNEEGLARLAWQYLKLLHAKQALAVQPRQEAELTQAVMGLETELSDMSLSPAARDGKFGTLQVLKGRLEVLRKRWGTQRAIEVDLLRIETQVQTELEQASLRGSGYVISGDVALTSEVLDADYLDVLRARTSGRSGGASQEEQAGGDGPVEREKA